MFGRNDNRQRNSRHEIRRYIKVLFQLPTTENCLGNRNRFDNVNIMMLDVNVIGRFKH